MFIRTRVRDKNYVISVGEGTQSLRWLGVVSLMRYFDGTGTSTGDNQTILDGQGKEMDMNSCIKDVLHDQDNVTCVIPGDGRFMKEFNAREEVNDEDDQFSDVSDFYDDKMIADNAAKEAQEEAEKSKPAADEQAEEEEENKVADSVDKMSLQPEVPTALDPIKETS